MSFSSRSNFMWRCSQISLWLPGAYQRWWWHFFLEEIKFAFTSPFRMMCFPSQQLVVLADLLPWNKVMQHYDMSYGFSRAVSHTAQGSFPLLARAARELVDGIWTESFQQGAVFTAALYTEMCFELKLLLIVLQHVKDLCQRGEADPDGIVRAVPPLSGRLAEWTRHDWARPTDQTDTSESSELSLS